MDQSLKSRIRNYIQTRDYWISGMEIEKLAMNANFKASNASRRLRELASEGEIVSKVEGGFVKYRSLTQ